MGQSFAGGDKPSALSKKLYFCDNGIASILANLSEGALFENAVFNQLRYYGDLHYLAKGNEYEVDFIVMKNNKSTALEVKYHPILSDDQKIKRISAKYPFAESWLIGKYPAPSFSEFVWAGLIFYKEKTVQTATATANPNIAFIKYCLAKLGQTNCKVCGGFVL